MVVHVRHILVHGVEEVLNFLVRIKRAGGRRGGEEVLERLVVVGVVAVARVVRIPRLIEIGVLGQPLVMPEAVDRRVQNPERDIVRRCGLEHVAVVAGLAQVLQHARVHLVALLHRVARDALVGLTGGRVDEVGHQMPVVVEENHTAQHTRLVEDVDRFEVRIEGGLDLGRIRARTLTLVPRHVHRARVGAREEVVAPELLAHCQNLVREGVDRRRGLKVVALTVVVVP
mmetsp:Transcript_5804/g.13646  ORF Transcript_5804/g.13646 Transcript_5804/m.13646 type:complete len:229 (-) Transcript_5804:1287-1973(-)